MPGAQQQRPAPRGARVSAEDLYVSSLVVLVAAPCGAPEELHSPTVAAVEYALVAALAGGDDDGAAGLLVVCGLARGNKHVASVARAAGADPHAEVSARPLGRSARAEEDRSGAAVAGGSRAHRDLAADARCSGVRRTDEERAAARLGAIPSAKRDVASRGLRSGPARLDLHVAALAGVALADAQADVPSAAR